MADSASILDPIVAARIAALEALVDEQRAALDEKQAALQAEREAREAEQVAHVLTKAERDRLREAYEALTRDVELARRRLVIAKAERVDTTQLELEFATKLADLDALSKKAEDEIGEKPEGGDRTGRKKPKPRGRRDLCQLDLPEERIPIPDPLLEGSVVADRCGRGERRRSVEAGWVCPCRVRARQVRCNEARDVRAAYCPFLPTRRPPRRRLPATRRRRRACRRARPKSSPRSSPPIRALPAPSS